MKYNDIVFVKENFYDAYEDDTISDKEILIFLLHRPDKSTILVERLNGTIIQFNEDLIESKTTEQTIEILNKRIIYFNNVMYDAFKEIAHNNNLIGKAQKKIKSAEFSIPKLQTNFDRLSVAKRLMGNNYYGRTEEAKAFREEHDNAQNLYFGTKNAIKKHSDRIEYLHKAIKVCEDKIEKYKLSIKQLETYRERYNV